MSHPLLSFADIDAFDPTGPSHRKWCPLCGADKPRDGAHRSLSLDRAQGLWKCFRCGAAGKASEFWTTSPPNSRRARARQTLDAAFSLSVEAPAKPLEAPAKPLEIESDEAATEGAKRTFDWRLAWETAQPLAQTEGERFLVRRGIEGGAARAAGVRFCSRWSGVASVVFPILNRQGELVAAQGRGVRGDAKITHGPKKTGAFFAPVTLGARAFGPLDPPVPAIILTEAPIDALSLATCGFPALALCGTSGPSWLHLPCGLRRVLLALDDDEAGDRGAESIERALSPFGARCQRLRFDGFKDPNEWLLSAGAGVMGDALAALLL